ncbi:MAG: M28 family peptidase [Saprospiraceae bacterium]|nr:M28 family peptidase [Saprospiraceae bacterium]
MLRRLVLVSIILSFLFELSGQETTKDIYPVFRKIGLEESKVMELASMICDVHGPRLTGSSGLDKAQDWAVSELKSWGMVNVEKEEWGEFGRGWQLERFAMHANTPDYWPVLAYPKAWSGSTKGLITGEVIYLQANGPEDLIQYKGKLKDKFVLLDTIRDVKEWFKPSANRHNAESLLEMANSVLPTPRPRRDWARTGGMSFNKELWEFLYQEKPLCIVDRNYKGDLGTVFVTSARTPEGVKMRDQGVEIVPQVTMSVEQYNRLIRLIQKGIKPKLSLDLQAKYEMPHKGMEQNILAEIPGSDLQSEVVIFGAHFDSWHAGTGATDNGAGSAVMMEAARILLEYIKVSGEKPRRTLRLALWSGEEQGLLGSREYVRKHFAEMEPGGWIPKSLKPAQETVSAYYNLDNGTGKVRGIYLQGNENVMSIFKNWLDPFKDLEANTVTLKNTGGTDHQAFDGVGIPGFQFIQDEIAYSNSTHHSNMDNWDHLIEDDLKQAATIIATIVWNTAQRDDKLPRKHLKIETPSSSGTN